MTRRLPVALGLGVLLAAAPAAPRAQTTEPPAIRILLPREGAAGLRAGAEVEVLGVPAGTVRRIQFGPERRLVAEIELSEAAAHDFIRGDSPVAIRQRRGA